MRWMLARLAGVFRRRGRRDLPNRMIEHRGNLNAGVRVAGLLALVLALSLVTACSGESAAPPAASTMATEEAPPASGASRPTFTPVPTATVPTAANVPAPDTPQPGSTPAPTALPLAATPTPAPETIPSLLQLVDPLDEPEFYCVDVPGFRDSLRTDRPLQAHTCKPGAEDELFRFNFPEAGQLYMAAYDRCVEAEGDLAYTRGCTGSAAQRFTHTPNGELRTEQGELCLGVAGGSGEPAGGPSHLRRNLRWLPCVGVEPELSRWLFPGPNPRSEAETAARLMYSALESALEGEARPIERMGDSGDPAYIPVLVEFLRFPWWQLDREVEVAIHSSLERIAAQNFFQVEPQVGTELATGPDRWMQWVLWVNRHPEVTPPVGFAGWKGELFATLVDPEMGAFLYDGAPSNIRLEEIVWGGVPKDGIPDLTNPPVIAGVEATYLAPEDRVFGVSFNGEHRAYPHRIANAHEMVNDVVGGVSFALAY